jgi:hypothetical protein
VNVYFPKAAGGGLGQTQRPWAYGGGTPNSFFVEGDANGNGTLDRVEARSDFVNNFFGQASQYTRNAGINFYWNIDANTPEITFGRTDGIYAHTTALGNATPEVKALADAGPTNVMRVYFVQGIGTTSSTSTTSLGSTYMNRGSGSFPYGKLILMGDNAEPDTLAHEVMHFMGIPDHMDHWEKMRGKLNNLKDVISDWNSWLFLPADRNPLNWNLLRSKEAERLDPPRGTLLTDFQASLVYSNSFDTTWPYSFFSD